MTDEIGLLSSTPEAQGVGSAGLLRFVDAAERLEHNLHSLVVVRHGHIVASGWWQPYEQNLPHMLFSVSKSFTSTAIGLLVADGRLSLDMPVFDLFPDDTPPDMSAHLRAMRVRHLLTMSTGHESDPTHAVFNQREIPWTRAFLALPIQHEPGTHFVYNTAATYMLSAIVQRLTGQRMRDFLEPRLFQPLGIPTPEWETSPQGIDMGGTGLSITTDALARFGQLYLQRGLWHGQQIIPSAWIDEATAFHVPNAPSPNPDWEQGYGYQFWRCQPDRVYRADGAFGQFCVVLPDQDAVVAINAGVAAMQPVLNLVWTYLLPSFHAVALPADSTAQHELETRLSTLSLAPVQGQPRSPLVGSNQRLTFAISPNSEGVTTLSLDYHDDGCDLTVHNQNGEQQISCGYQQWRRGAATLEQAAAWPYAASGAWSDDQTYRVEIWWVSTPYRRTLTFHFHDALVTVDQHMNVMFGPVDKPRLEGRQERA